MIAAIRDNLDIFTFTKIKAAGGKFVFRLSKDGLVLATSRKYTTEGLLQKGIDEIVKYVSVAETLDFSENEIFPDVVFADAE